MRGRVWGSQIVRKMNENHDERGRFASGPGGGAPKDQPRVTPENRDRVEHDTDNLVGVAMAQDPRVAAAEKLNEERGQTINDPGVMKPDGTGFTDAAQAENDTAKDVFFEGAAPVGEGGRPQAYIVIGRPGAGKSTAFAQPPNTVLINSDNVMAELPGYDPRLAPSQYARASAVTAQLQDEVITNRYNMYYDGTGKTPESMAKLADTLKDYDLHVVYVDNARAADRAYARFKNGGRYVPAHVMANTRGLSRIKDSYKLLKGRAKSYQHWDNSASKNYGGPKLIEKGP